MAQVSDELIRSAAALASSDPAAWDRLVRAMEHHFWTLARETVGAMPENVQIAQGSARQAHVLFEAFRTCRETAPKLKS